MAEEQRNSQQDVTNTPPNNKGGQKVTFNDQISILVDQPRPEFSHKYANAYTAQSPDHSCVAVVCELGTQPRVRWITQYTKILSDTVPKLIAAAVIVWPNDKTQRMVFVYEDVCGQPLSDVDTGFSMGWKAEHVQDRIVIPVLSLLRATNQVDLVHGSIRPSNLFNGGKAGGTSTMLGECLSYAGSSTQPALFEPIERAMAHPMGRGPTTFSDDVYALGVTAALFYRSKDVLRNPSEEDMIRAKQEVGSYAALLGDMRIAPNLQEFFRGALIDDPKDRWTMSDVEAWLDGRRSTPKQIARHKPASRPFEFAGKKFTRPKVLATAITRYPNEAAALINSDELAQWANRALKDMEMIDRIEGAGRLARDPMNKINAPDKIATLLSLAVDPDACIRFHDISFMPDGLGVLMADAYRREANMQPFVDILLSPIVTYWLSSTEKPYIDNLTISQKFDQCRNMMKNSQTPGFGVERAVYILNQEAPCLSSMFKHGFVRTPEDVVFGLNEACKQSPKPSRLLDRHIIAFLAERDRKAIEMHMFDINSGRPAQMYLGTLRCLSALQKRSNISKLPELTLWMAELIKPIYATFHDRDLRNEVKKKVDKIKNDGHLWRILEIVTDPNTLARDQALFAHAFNEYKGLRVERDNLTTRLQNPQLFGKRTGMEVATMVSSILAFIVAAGLIMVFLQNGGM